MFTNITSLPMDFPYSRDEEERKRLEREKLEKERKRREEAHMRNRQKGIRTYRVCASFPLLIST